MAGRFTMPGTGFGMCLYRSVREALSALLAAMALSAMPSPARATMPPRSGTAPPAVTRAFSEGLFALPERSEGLATSAARPVWRIPVILVSFSDSSLRYRAADFERQLFDTTGSTATGSVYDYYQWVSRGRLAVHAQVVATVRLRDSLAYYGAHAGGLAFTETPTNSYGMARDALQICQASVDWSEFDLDRDGYVDMLWLVHAGTGGEASVDRNPNNLWSITSRMTNRWRGGGAFPTTDPVPGSASLFMKIDRFTILPELSAFSHGAISEIGVYCHEFGHALDLPDLYTLPVFGSGPVDYGPGNWSLMSYGAYGTDGRSPQFPSHLGAWPLQFLRWDRTFRPARDTTVVLEPLENGGPIMEFWFQGEHAREHFLIENRQRLKYDQNLLTPGLIIYHVDDVVMTERGLPMNSINSGTTPGLRLVEADGDDDLWFGRNHGDSSDPFPGDLNRSLIDDSTRPNTFSFLDRPTNIALRDIAPVGQSVRFVAQVRARGWLPPSDFTGPEFQPIRPFGFARVSGVGQNGQEYWIGSETRSGHSQVILRGGRGDWDETFQVSASSAGALDPALAVLPGGDLAIVWSDERSGKSELFYRSRIRGVWTRERLLISMPGNCRYPAIGVDARGSISMAFQYITASQVQIRFMRFTYFSPFGQSMAVTRAAQRPGSPAMTVSSDGIAYTLWADRAISPQRLWFCRNHPDSGLSLGFPLTTPPMGPSDAQLGFSAIVGGDGTLHTVWQTSGPGVSQLHYQRRPRSDDPKETLIESEGYLLENPVVAADADDGLHVVFEASPSGVTQARYLHFSPRQGWDAMSTEVTFAEDGSISHPQPLPASSRELSVAYAQYPGNQPHLRVRRRVLETAPVAALSVPAPVRSGLLLGPNPIRSGDMLHLAWPGPAGSKPPVVELFDLSGRRVAGCSLQPSGPQWEARLPGAATRAWSSGVYFARVRAQGTGATRLVVIH